jgi:hypothetical protein
MPKKIILSVAVLATFVLSFPMGSSSQAQTQPNTPTSNPEPLLPEVNETRSGLLAVLVVISVVMVIVAVLNKTRKSRP